MVKVLNLTYEEQFKISNTALRLNRSHPTIRRDLKWKFQFFIFIGIYIICTFCLCYSIIVHDIKSGKYDEASKNGAMVVVAINITYKYFLLLVRQKEIQQLIDFINKDYGEDNNYSDEDKDIVIEYADKGVTVSQLWLFGGISSCVIFPLKAFVCMGYYYSIGEFRLVAMFELTLPEPFETLKNRLAAVFWIWFLLTLLFDICTTTMYVGFDSLVPIFMLHVSGQIVILSKRLNKLFDEVENISRIQNELKSIVIKLQSLYKFMDCIKEYFAVLYECNMKTTTFLLPFTAILIVQDLQNIWKNPEHVIFFFGSILHFFIPCYYSDLLMEQSANFREAIYSSGWTKCPNKSVRQTILYMLTRAISPMGIKTVFYEINLDTFAEMCRQAYSIFSIINASQ